MDQGISAERLTRRAFIGAAATFPVAWSTRGYGNPYGHYVGKVVTEWLEQGRNMRLTQPFELVQASGRRWPVPAGTDVDGASIPKVFWSFIGGPFEGRYREASVIHDYFCEVKTRPYIEVHQIFYEGMMISGVDQSSAWIMYKAVDVFGPRWERPIIPPQCEIVSDKYDFSLCARNSKPIEIRANVVSRDAIELFVSDLSGSVDPSKLEKFRNLSLNSI